MIDILKMHGTGNTFFLIDERKTGLIPENLKIDLSIKLCENNADGILFVENSSVHDVKMRIFNADGTEPEMCGNGLRCFARYVLESEDKEKLIVETMYDKYEVAYVKDFFENMVGIKIVINNVLDLNHEKINEFSGRHNPYRFNYYTVSNPHIVTFSEKILDENALKVIGEDANLSKDIFDEGMNVNILTELSEGKIYVQTFERGVGITKSCGTGMTSASVFYSQNRGFIGRKIEVFNDGGMIFCTVHKDSNCYKVDFLGNGTYIYEAKLDILNEEIMDIKINHEEKNKYDRFYDYTRKKIKDLC